MDEGSSERFAPTLEKSRRQPGCGPIPELNQEPILPHFYSPASRGLPLNRTSQGSYRRPTATTTW